MAFPAFVVVGLALYYPCFAGPFLSDDLFAVLNPYLTPLTLEKIVDLFSPHGATSTMIGEYRPLWFLLHGVERLFFGESVLGYHVVNVVLHGIASGLLVLVFCRSRLPTRWAIFGGSFFLVHPANVEAVAWISQLTGVAALVLGLGALLLRPRHPTMALLSFTLALLTKPLAAFALPVAALWTWTERGEGATGRGRWGRIAAWLLVFIVFSVVETIVVEDPQKHAEPMHADTIVVGRTIVANFQRYVVMAATGYGVSAFHQALPALSWFDLWWLCGIGTLVVIGWRTAHAIRRRREEAVYWLWAVVAFAPISQVIPFTNPVADRYLYFIMPGLIGGTLLAARSALEHWPSVSQQQKAARLGTALAAVLLLMLASLTHQRAELWSSFENLAQDSMRHYPDGLWAHLLRSRRAAEEGDGERSAAELRAAFELGHREYGTVVSDPVWGRVLRHPSFQRVLIDMAGWWIRRIGEFTEPKQIHLYQLASAHWLRGEASQAQNALERALAAGGPLDESIRGELARLRGSAGRTTPQ